MKSKPIEMCNKCFANAEIFANNSTGPGLPDLPPLCTAECVMKIISKATECAMEMMLPKMRSAKEVGIQLGINKVINFRKFKFKKKNNIFNKGFNIIPKGKRRWGKKGKKGKKDKKDKKGNKGPNNKPSGPENNLSKPRLSKWGVIRCVMKKSASTCLLCVVETVMASWSKIASGFC